MGPRRPGIIVSAGAMALAARACGRSTPAESARADVAVPPAAPAAWRPSPGVVATTAIRRSPPPSPSLALPAGADPVAVAFAEMVCGVAVKRDPTGLAVGCRDCGNMTPGEELLELKESDTFYPTLAVLRGSFTAPGADEAVMLLEGCGRGMLFANDGSSWAPDGHFSGRDPFGCVAVAGGDGRDRLACTSGLGASDVGSRYELYTEQLTSGVEYPETKTLVIFRDNGDSPCRIGGDHFTALRWASLEAKDVNGDGLDDVVAVVTKTSSAVTPAVKAKLATLCAPGPSGPPLFVDPKDYLPPPVSIELRWLTTRDGHTPTPETATRLQTLPVWVDPPPE
jgi:hypothetical protein